MISSHLDEPSPNLFIKRIKRKIFVIFGLIRFQMMIITMHLKISTACLISRSSLATVCILKVLEGKGSAGQIFRRLFCKPNHKPVLALSHFQRLTQIYCNFKFQVGAGEKCKLIYNINGANFYWSLLKQMEYTWLTNNGPLILTVQEIIFFGRQNI